ncbi:PilZ domain-containing protein [Sphingomonas sp. CJ99]
MRAATSLAYVDNRAVDRDEVHFRARATGPGGRPLTLLIVNLSPHGLMARTDAVIEPGTALRVHLPVVGQAMVDVRWSLGGRIGGQFDTPIDRATYYQLLAQVMRG